MVYLSTRKGRRMSNYSDCRQRLTPSRNQATEEWWEVGLPRAKTGNWCSNSHHLLVISHSSLKQHVSYKSNDVSLTLPRGSDAPRVQKPRDVYWWNCNRQHHSPGKATNHCTWQGKPREAGEVMCPAPAPAWQEVSLPWSELPTPGPGSHKSPHAGAEECCSPGDIPSLAHTDLG